MLVLGLVFVMGAAYGRNSTIEEGLAWAVATTAECESSYEAEGYRDVTDCVQDAAWRVEDERREI